MNKVSWAIVSVGAAPAALQVGIAALLATLMVNALPDIRADIRALEERLSTDIRQVESRLYAIEDRLDVMDRRITRLEERVEIHLPGAEP